MVRAVQWLVNDASFEAVERMASGLLEDINGRDLYIFERFETMTLLPGYWLVDDGRSPPFVMPDDAFAQAYEQQD
jgi:hypothetical protein